MEDPKNNDEKSGLGSLFTSMVELGEATTKFTMTQVQNAVGILTHPTETVERMKESIDTFSEAMNHSVAPAKDVVVETTEPAPASDTLTGRKQ